MTFTNRLTFTGIVLLAVAVIPAHVVGEAMASEDIAQIQSTLSSNLFASGEFIQVRQLKAIPRPLNSSGKFAIWSQHGIYWQTEQPFFSATSYTTDDVIDWNEDLQALPSNNTLGTIQKYINEVMVALFEVDNEALARYFSSQWSGTPNNWELQLIPTRSTVRRSIKSIQLMGGTLIQRIVLESAEGEKTDIQFNNVITQQSVAANYCARFFRKLDQQCDSL